MRRNIKQIPVDRIRVYVRVYLECDNPEDRILDVGRVIATSTYKTIAGALAFANRKMNTLKMANELFRQAIIVGEDYANYDYCAMWEITVFECGVIEAVSLDAPLTLCDYK